MTSLGRWILDSVPAMVAMVGLVAGASLLLLGWRVRSRSWRAAASTTLGDAALMASLGLVALLTLTAAPIGAQPDRVNLLPFRDQLWALEGRLDATIALATLLGNVALFVPLGVALAARSPARRGWMLVLLGMAVSVGVELVQALLLGFQGYFIRKAGRRLWFSAERPPGMGLSWEQESSWPVTVS